MSWRRTADERPRWNDRRVAERRCSDRDIATLEARNLSEQILCLNVYAYKAEIHGTGSQSLSY